MQVRQRQQFSCLSTDRLEALPRSAAAVDGPGMSISPHAMLPVARLRGPGDVAAALPHLCGFVPTESLVVVALQGPRSRVRLTMRVDLPGLGQERPLADEVVQRMRHAQADAVLLVVCTDSDSDAGGLPRRQLVRRLRRALDRAGVGCDDALLVRDNRWWSYRCSEPRCCPAEGTPLSATGGQGLTLLQAQSAWQGRAVLASRADLVEALAAPTGPDAAALGRLLAAELAQLPAGADRATAGAAALREWRHALARAGEPPLELADPVAARLAASLADVVVRDEVLSWLLDDDDALLTLLLALAARCPAPWDAPVCALLAWVAHGRGDGGLANVALDRALASQPRYSLALLSRQALDGQVPPSDVRNLVGGSRRLLRSVHPWTAP